MKAVLLIQHCQSVHHVTNLTGGWTDTPLTDFGRRQATAVAARAARMIGKDPCRIYASDLQRAWQTAEIVARELQVEPVAAPELRENNGGIVTGKTREWAEANINMDNWSLFDWHGFPGGETTRQFYHRVAGWLEQLWQTHPEGEVPILVGHGGSISHVVVWWLGLPLDVLPDRHPFVGSPGGLGVLRVNRHGQRVIGVLNDLAHLRQANLEEEISLSD